MKCRVCGAAAQQFLSLGEQPRPNHFLARDQLALPEPRYPLELHFCPGCTLVQLGATVPPEEMFSHYLYASSTSPLTRQHFSNLTARLHQDLSYHSKDPYAGPVRVVDIASNDGIMLRAWRDLGVAAIGVEPAANLCQLAQADGLETLNEFFTRQTVLRIGRHSAHLVTAINVFAHVPKVRQFAKDLRSLLHPHGFCVIEVQYFRDMVEGLSFDNIYAEHVFYFTLHSLERVLAEAGLRIFDAEQVDTHGGSLRVYACTQKFYSGDTPATRRLRHEEQALGLDRLDTCQEFAKRVEQAGHQLRERLQAIKKAGKTIVGYGAAAKSTTILNYCGIGPETVSYIVDDSPLKQGTWTPGTHIPVVGPEELEKTRPDYIIMLAWNFAQAIMEKTQYLGANYIFPIPPGLLEP